MGDARCTQHYGWCTYHFKKISKLSLHFLRICAGCVWGLRIKLIRKRLTDQGYFSSSSFFFFFFPVVQELFFITVVEKIEASLSAIKWNASEKFNSMDANREQIVVDVGSVVEVVSADDSHAPLYIIESLCMCCHENVNFFLL